MIYILPGMGADHRMYPAPWNGLPECTFIKWPKYSGELSLSEVASKIVSIYPINHDAWIVGSSLGGMIACEVAKLVPINGIILVGSACNPTEISTLLRMFSPLADLAPLPFIQRLAGKVPSELTQMFSDSDPAFIRAMCRAIIRWEGITNTKIQMHRIHGRNDLVIPLPDKTDLVLNGGHLIAMTHAEECVAYVRKIVAK